MQPSRENTSTERRKERITFKMILDIKAVAVFGDRGIANAACETVAIGCALL
jgi:hypothetical protein